MLKNDVVVIVKLMIIRRTPELKVYVVHLCVLNQIWLVFEALPWDRGHISIHLCVPEGLGSTVASSGGAIYDRGAA